MCLPIFFRGWYRDRGDAGVASDNESAVVPCWLVIGIQWAWCFLWAYGFGGVPKKIIIYIF